MATATTKKVPATLGEALAAFQADLPEITLDGVNPHFKSKYATLSGITKKVLPALAENGLAFSVGSFVDNGLLVLDARLIHTTTGEFLSAKFPITEANPQKVGSAVTYYRRYALSALTGIVADEDDDGNAASGSVPVPPAVQKAKEAAGATKATSAKPAETDSKAQIRTKYLDTGKVTLEELNAIVNKVQNDLNHHKKDEKTYAEVLKRLDADNA